MGCPEPIRYFRHPPVSTPETGGVFPAPRVPGSRAAALFPSVLACRASLSPATTELVFATGARFPNSAGTNPGPPISSPYFAVTFTSTLAFP